MPACSLIDNHIAVCVPEILPGQRRGCLVLLSSLLYQWRLQVNELVQKFVLMISIPLALVKSIRTKPDQKLSEQKNKQTKKRWNLSEQNKTRSCKWPTANTGAEQCNVFVRHRSGFLLVCVCACDFLLSDLPLLRRYSSHQMLRLMPITLIASLSTFYAGRMAVRSTWTERERSLHTLKRWKTGAP